VQAPPYALLAKRDIKSIKELAGKTIIVGGAKDITRIFVDRMLAANGLKAPAFDYVFAGATNARFSALQSAGSTRRCSRRRSISTPRPPASPISASPLTTCPTCRSPASP
jgi:hypothetical protein